MDANIPVTAGTLERLDAMRACEESYDDVIRGLLQEVEREHAWIAIEAAAD